MKEERYIKVTYTKEEILVNNRKCKNCFIYFESTDYVVLNCNSIKCSWNKSYPKIEYIKEEKKSKKKYLVVAESFETKIFDDIESVKRFVQGIINDCDVEAKHIEVYVIDGNIKRCEIIEFTSIDIK